MGPTPTHCSKFTGESSNGKTFGSEPKNRDSISCLPAKLELNILNSPAGHVGSNPTSEMIKLYCLVLIVRAKQSQLAITRVKADCKEKSTISVPIQSKFSSSG